VAVTTNHRDEVAQLLADYRRSREQLASVQRTLLSITESASSPDGLITATVDSAGTLTKLLIAEDAYRRYRPADLAETVVRVTKQAAARAGERARQALAPVLPADADPGAVLNGTADLTPAEIDPQPAVAARPARAATTPSHDDDDSYEETTWMNRAGGPR
jgi:DNA-binding protein YbaB